MIEPAPIRRHSPLITVGDSGLAPQPKVYYIRCWYCDLRLRYDTEDQARIMLFAIFHDPHNGLPGCWGRGG